MDTLVNDLFESPLRLTVSTAFLGCVGYVIFQLYKSSSRVSGASAFPPGPPRQFLIGNLRQFPRTNFHEKFTEWQKDYGNIVSVDIFGKPIIILNSYDIAQEFLSKRPNATAGRDGSYMMREVMGLRWALSRLQPGPTHGNQRKMLRRGIGPQRVGSHDPLIESNIIQLILRLQSFEGNPHRIVLRATGSIVVEVAYGKKVLAEMTEELSSWNREVMELASKAFGTFYLVNYFHFLRFVPSWFPGATFRRIGDQSTLLSSQIRNIPYAKARELYQSGEIGHSLATDLLDEFGPNEDAQDALAFLYAAGADTTSAAIMAFIHALYLFPEVSQKVYNEIVEITNGTRLPNIADRSKMSYTEAVWMETFRWKTFLPMGVPHASTQDEIVNGYLIKSGSQIIPNNWSMMMDEKVWGNPNTFRPERFLGPDADSLPNPLSVTFGYGMRTCPGMYLADRVGFYLGTTVAALYNIVPMKGQSRPKPESVKYAHGVVSLPIGFECRFVPKDEQSRHLLKVIATEE